MALKMIQKSILKKDREEDFKQEIEILRQLDHPNIIKLKDVYEDDKKIYIITEFCYGGELFSKIKEKNRFREKDAQRIFRQLIYAINYCHQLGIVHMDLKPENVMLTSSDEDSQVKIIDFGLSQSFKNHEKMTQSLGTV